jgi:PhnB protein
MSEQSSVVISLMLGVPDAGAAVSWYERAVGAEQMWNFGNVVGLHVRGAPFFVAEPSNDDWKTPSALGSTTTRVEVFVDDPDAFIKRAVEAGADGGSDPVKDHQTGWGKHRQGGFIDPFGHVWLVGDTSPLRQQESASS